ncbi:SDR family NAD(P)-dependent oxidoreductase [Streptomyces sp. NPDC047022]|uniref:SDR family NAD(P)-dependent oxidoreductase n=1 Tax=Streptomyces sp. NPDC047022 TaxID=3155737 RepID=UPI0033E8709E
MNDTVWLVTGSGRGLGREIARAALEAGDRVVATARDVRQLDDLVGGFGDAVVPVRLDVTDAAGARQAVTAAVEVFGRLDVVVNNAGYATLASIEDTTEEEFRRQIDTNLFGVVNVTRAALPVLREQGSGHVITVSSVGARTATAGLGAYQTAKWAVSGFSEVLAQEVAPLGIKVTAVEPGGMRTQWAGASMAVPPVSAAYEPTVGMVAKFLEPGNDRSAGDPVKVARAIRAVAAMDEPPVRLLLGSDALNVAGASAAALAARDAAFAGLTRSTDHDDVTAAERDPLGVGD